MVICRCVQRVTALFRKIDFEKTGGYDKTFDIALEDYDLWLNFVFRYNKKIYRVPEILFYYRMKDKKDSRNLQHCEIHKQLTKSFFKKYPQMLFYKKLHKLFNILKKIGHFFFRIKHNKIQICKISICRIANKENL